MNVLDLFTGIGGMSLGLERAGMHTVAFCELDPYCQAVLRKHWPDIQCHSDARLLHAGDVPRFDLIAGGPPCQRTSVVSAVHGYRTGETLWPEMARLIEEGHPEWAIIEQPSGNSRWEDQVKGDLASLGYHSSRLEREASDSGAPHRRRRVFYVANPLRERCDQVSRLCESPAAEQEPWPAPPGGIWRTTRARDRGMDDGLSAWVYRIRALGNAVFPPDAQAIGEAIMTVNALNSSV